MPLEFDIVTGLSTENSQILKQDTALRLAKIYDDNRPNLDTGSVTMPQVPNLIGDARLAPQEDRSDLAMKNWLQKARQMDQDLMSGSGTESLISAKGTDKYLDQAYGYNPQRDNEDFYAQQQSAISEIPKALVKFVPLTLAKVGTGLGYLAGLADPTNWGEGYVSNAADNGLVRTFDSLENTIKNEWMPTFQEANDRDKGFFSRAFTDLNFWTEDTLDAAAFMASAFVPGLGISKIGVGAKASQLLSRLGIAAENGVLGNTGLAKLASYMRNAQSLAQTLDKATITALNTASEAMWEAKGVRDGVMESLSGKINPSTGREYTDLEKRNIAGESARNTFMANAALLSVSNLWEANLLYKALGKEGKSVSNIVQKNLGSAFEAAKSASRLEGFFESKPGAVLKAFGEGLATEGLYEENMQLAVQRVYDGTNKYNNVLTQLFGQTRDAIAGNDPEAAISIGLGGLIGGIAGGIGNIRDIAKRDVTTQQMIENLNQAQSSWLSFGSLYQRGADGKVVLDEHNRPVLDVNKANAAIENWSQMTNLKVAMDATTSPELTSVIQKEAFAKFVKAHINAGIEDQIVRKLDGLSKMTDEQLVLMGYDPSSADDRALEIAQLQTYARQLIDLHKSIDNDILYKPGSDNAGEYALRKNYLYTLGARQLALQSLSSRLDGEMTSLKNRIDTTTGTSVEDDYVDQLNYLKQRIKAQRSLIDAIDDYTLDGTDVDLQAEREELSSLAKEFNNLRDSNKELYNSLTLKNELYQYPNAAKNRNVLTQAYQKKQKQKAELDNSAKSVNTEFYNAGDIDNGAQYFRRKIEAELEKTKVQVDNEIPDMQPEVATPGASKTIKMQSLADQSQQVDVELTEGQRYLGGLTKTVYGSQKGLRGTAFNNDNIKIIKINEDGTVTLTVNNDAPVTFTEEELAQIPALKKYADLSPLQKFYIENRNKVFQYRIPIKYNKQTKRWETSVVSGRLSYDKKNNILNIAYKVGEQVKYIEFDPKYVKSSFDISSLPSDEQLAIQEQQQRLDSIRKAQYKLFESLINNTDAEIKEQADRTTANLQATAETEERLNRLVADLERYQKEFEKSDTSKADDKRTKAGRLQRVINRLQSEISTVESQLSSLRAERNDIAKRQSALEFMMEEYLTAYDSLLDTNQPVLRSEMDYLQHRKAELEGQDKGARYTIEQIENQLLDTLAEQDINEATITRLEGYLDDLNDHLKRFKLEYGVAELFDEHPNITELRDFLKAGIANADTPADTKELYRRTLARVNKDPKFFYDVRFIQKEIRDTISTMDRAIRGSVYLQDRIDALTDNLSLKQEIQAVDQRINALKTVFTGLANEFEKEKASKLYSTKEQGDKTVVKAITIEDAKSIQENEKLFSEFLTEPPIGDEVEREIEYWSTDKPVMVESNNPLFKSADSHFPNNELNPQPYTQRFFKFTSQMNLADGYSVMPVTADNDVYGIRFNNEIYQDDVKFIVVKKTKDGYSPIDINGQALANPTKDNIIYSSFYGHPDLLAGGERAVQWVKDNMAPKNLTDAQIEAKVNEYLAFRAKVKDDIRRYGNQYYSITSKSNGVQNREPKDTTTGTYQQLPVEGRLTDRNPNWNDVDLVLSTVGGQIAGSTNVTMKPGRTAIRVNGSVMQVYNRLLLPEERDRLKRLVKQLTYSFGRKSEYETIKAAGGVLSPEEEASYTKDINTANLITQYLSTILYWDRPISGKQRTKNQFQIQSGFLRRGSGTEEVAIPFNADSIERDFDRVLDGVYHQIANRLIGNSNPYRVLDIDSNGDLTYTTWGSYKEYLLSSKGRQNGETPIYTNIVERSNDQTKPQLINVYLTYSQDSLSKPQTGDTASSSKVSIDKNTISKLNGDYTLRYTNPKSNTTLTVDFTWTSPTNNKITKTTIEQGNVTQEKANTFSESLLGIVKSLISTEIEEGEAVSKVAEDKIAQWQSQGTTLELYKRELIQKDYTQQPASQPDPKLEATITAPPTEPTVPSTPQVSEDIPQTPDINDILRQYDNNINKEAADDDNYRVPTYDENTEYVRENEQATRAWFDQNLPQYTVNFVDNLIKGKYWGQFKEGAVWISREAEHGTGFHEAFEAVWNSILSPTQQQGLIDEFKRRTNYKQLVAQTASTWKGLNEDELIKETLAEEFREYVISDGKAPIVKGQAKRNGFFRQLWNFIKGLFINKREDELYTIDELFTRLNNRGFANTPLRNYDKAVANFKRIPNVSQEVSTELIEGMTAQFFKKLFSKQENTDSLFSKASNFKLINDILTEIRDQNRISWELDIMSYAGIESGVFKTAPPNREAVRAMVNNLSVDELAKIQAKREEFRLTNKYNYRDKLIINERFKDSVLPIFYDYLRQYGFVIKSSAVEEEDFDEVNDVENRESNATDTLGIKESITIDTRNTAATTIKLLVASLLNSRYASNGAILENQNSLGLPMIVDYDKTLNTLFNELQGISTVFKNGKRVDAVDLMFDKLDTKFKDPSTDRYKPGYLWIYDLKRKLKYADKNGVRLDVSSLTEEQIRLRVAFIKSFSKAKNSPKKLIFGDGGNIYSLDPISSSNAYRIRESWENNAKAAVRGSNDYLKIENNKVTINTTSEKMKSLLSSRSLLDKAELLRRLGIVFSIPDNEIVTYKQFGDAALRISSFISDGTIVTFDDLFSKQIVNGPINQLLSIELNNNADNLSLQYRNPEGQNEYSIVNPSNFSNVLNSLKAASNIHDFLMNNPQLGTTDGINISLKPYLENSELLRVGGKLFDENGNKRRDIEYQLISGVAQANETGGEITARLKRPDKVIQEMFYLLEGSYYTIINSDKSSEFALNIGEFVPMFDFTSGSKAYSPETKRIYTNHLVDEVRSLIMLKNGVGNNIQYYNTNQYDKKTGQWLLSHFRDIIKDPTNVRMLQESIKNDTPEVFANNSRVQFEIAQYLDNFIKRQQEALIKIGIVERLPDNTYRTTGFSQEQLNKFRSQGLDLGVKSFNQAQFDNLARYLFINHQIGVREQHKLVYGHPAMYKDLPKRSNGATSTKEAIVDSPEVMSWMDANFARLDGKKRASEQIPTFKTRSYADVNVVSLFYKDIAEGMYKSFIKDMSKEEAEKRIGATFNNSGHIVKYNNTGALKAYIELNEADAQAYILPDFYRDLLFLSSKLSAGQTRQIEYEIAYERDARSKKDRSHPSYRAYTPEEVENRIPQKDQQTLSEGNPGYVLPVLKPQYFGPQVDGNHLHTTFLKHSVQPKFYRFFEDTNFESIYVNAQNTQTDIIGYESGEKVGNIFNEKGSFTSFYNEDGSVSTILPPEQVMYQKYYGVQVEMAAKLKDEVIRGTQMTKIIMANLFDNGVPITPEVQKTIDAYNNTLVHLVRLGKQELLRELGLEHLEDGSYVTYDLKKLVTTLRDEAAKRDLPSNIVEAFEASLQDSTTGLVYKFDSFSNRDKIDNILNSIVDSRVISQHMHGKAAVQAASTLYENLGSDRKLLYLKDGVYTEVSDYASLSSEDKKTIRIASSDLKFYHNRDGKIAAMEVYLPHWFKELYGKDESLSIDKLDPRLLNLIGFRIPTQGVNSIDNITVAGFLSPEEGDTVVVPSEIVGKSGSDFDIDKLNLYIPNYRIVNGEPVYIEPGNINDRKSLENALINHISELLSLPQNYRQLVVPNGAETLKALEQEIQSLMGISKEKSIPFTQLSEWDYMNETRERFLVGKQLVGIGAIHITNHALSQVSDIELTGTFEDQPIKIKFPHNERDGKLYLSAVTDKAGQWISELLSEALTGFVDAAKDPFVFNLNINPATAGVYFYLMRLGVPISSIAYFHTQPIITEYIKNQQTNESLLNKINGNELSKKEITMLTMSDYVTKAFPGLVKDSTGRNSDLRSLFYNADNAQKEFDWYQMRWVSPSEEAYKKAIRDVQKEITKLRGQIPIYTDSNLKQMISSYAKGSLDQGQARQQLSILSDFLDYQQQGSALGDFINAMSYDTARTKNIIENRLQEFKYDRVLRQKFIANPQQILDKTFIGEMRKEKLEVPKMFANYFVALHPNAQPSFNKIYELINNDNANMSDETKKDILNRYQNFFLNHLLHTVKVRVNENDTSLNNFYSLFFGNDSFAHQLKTLQDKYPNNKLLQELFPIVSTDRNNTDNVKMFTTKLSTYEANSTIEAAVNLLETAETDPVLKKFMDNLAIFAIIQSGVQQSPISYTKILPNELYAELVGTIFDKFTDTPFTTNPDVIYKQFFQNNFWNNTIVPSGNKGSLNNGVLRVPSFYRIAGYDFLSRRDQNKKADGTPYSRNEINDLIKNKAWDTLYSITLYQKFFEDEDRAYYRPVNKLGNKIYAIEAYTTDTKTMTKDQIALSGINGYIDESGYDDQINQIVSQPDPTAPTISGKPLTIQDLKVGDVVRFVSPIDDLEIGDFTISSLQGISEGNKLTVKKIGTSGDYLEATPEQLYRPENNTKDDLTCK